MSFPFGGRASGKPCLATLATVPFSQISANPTSCQVAGVQSGGCSRQPRQRAGASRNAAGRSAGIRCRQPPLVSKPVRRVSVRPRRATPDGARKLRRAPVDSRVRPSSRRPSVSSRAASTPADARASGAGRRAGAATVRRSRRAASRMDRCAGPVAAPRPGRLMRGACRPSPRAAALPVPAAPA